VIRRAAWVGALVALVVLPALVGRWAGRREGQVAVPSNDSETVETLPAGSQGPRQRQLQQLRRAVDEHPDQLEPALLFARLNLAEARLRSDPRYLGYAQAALALWWEQPQPPVEAIFLRASLRQSNHDFEGALSDLEEVLKAAPNHSEALLTQAVVFSVLSRYSEAEASCHKLQSARVPLVVAVCLAHVESLSGRAERAYRRLSAAMLLPGGAGTDEAVWALSTLGEVAVRLGKLEQAERHFQDALALEPGDAYLLGAFADFLLDQGRIDEVSQLLAGRTQSDGLLLRLAIAERRRHSSNAAQYRRLLAERFEASRRRGDTLHRREEARFALEIENDADRALKLAVENWSVQREPWDARILLESALAAGDAVAALPALKSLKDNRYQEPRIKELAQRFTQELP
jgi:Tfp pilus assembly protein PilF